MNEFILPLIIAIIVIPLAYTLYKSGLRADLIISDPNEERINVEKISHKDTER